MTLVCTANRQKLLPHIVLKRKSTPKNEDFTKGVHIHCQKKGWMNDEPVINQIKTVQFWHPGELLAHQSTLVLDAFRGHLTKGVKKTLHEGATNLVATPGVMTSQLQPLGGSPHTHKLLL